jgi:hypothetical protein
MDIGKIPLGGGVWGAQKEGRAATRIAYRWKEEMCCISIAARGHHCTINVTGWGPERGSKRFASAERAKWDVYIICVRRNQQSGHTESSTRARAITAINQWPWCWSDCWFSTKWRTRQWFNRNGAAPKWIRSRQPMVVQVGNARWDIREPSRIRFLITTKFFHVRLHAALRGCKGCGAWALSTRITCNNPKPACMTSMCGYEWSISLWYDGRLPSNQHHYRTSGYESESNTTNCVVEASGNHPV